MQVELTQMVGAVLVAPVLYLVRQCLQAWIEHQRLVRRVQMARSLPPGSTVREQLPDGNGIDITFGPSAPGREE